MSRLVVNSQVAGNAVKAVLFQLSHDLNVARGGGAGGGGLEPLEQSEWSYYAPSGSGEEVSCSWTLRCDMP